MIGAAASPLESDAAAVLRALPGQALRGELASPPVKQPLIEVRDVLAGLLEGAALHEGHRGVDQGVQGRDPGVLPQGVQAADTPRGTLVGTDRIHLESLREGLGVLETGRIGVVVNNWSVGLRRLDD